MSDQSPVPKDHPLMIAWEAYKLTEEYKNSLKWASTARVEDHGDGSMTLTYPHKEGSLWGAFMEGFNRRVMPASDVQEERSVRIPTSADEAELMEKLGFQYLAEHAPERLTDDGQIRAAAQSPPSRQAEPEMVECEWSEDNQDGCPYCSGEACAQCVPHGDPPCEHDSFERHQRRPAAAPDTEQAT